MAFGAALAPRAACTADTPLPAPWQESIEGLYVHDALVVFAGGGISVSQIRAGSRHVAELQREMDRSRRERLQSLGFEAAVATSMSAYHTKNFM